MWRVILFFLLLGVFALARRPGTAVRPPRPSVPSASLTGPPRSEEIIRRSTLQRRARTALGLLRQHGAAHLGRWLVFWLGYRRVVLQERPLDPLPPLVEAGIPLRFRFLEPADLEALVSYRPDHDADEALSRLARGDRCFTSWHDGRIVSSRWLVQGTARLDDLQRSVPLEPTAVYVYDAYTSPGVRGQRVAAAGSTRLARVLAAEGCTRMVASVIPWNRSGMRSAERAGFRETGRAASLVIGRLPGLRVPYVPPSHRAPR